MIPLLGVFRILAIVIFGMFPSALLCYCANCSNPTLNMLNLTPSSPSSWHGFWICLLQKICQRRGWFEGTTFLPLRSRALQHGEKQTKGLAKPLQIKSLKRDPANPANLPQDDSVLVMDLIPLWLQTRSAALAGT